MHEADYRAHVATYVRIARETLAENPDADVTAELHEWLNAPDSFLNWTTSERATEDVALDVLRHADNRHAGIGGSGYRFMRELGPANALAGDSVNYVYLAAWAFVADVEAALEGDDPMVTEICPCPCHLNERELPAECFCTPECIRGEARPLDVANREELVAWLAQNDPNGCHTDEDATLEMGAPHTLESALACYRAQWEME